MSVQVKSEVVTPKVNKTTNIKEYKKEHYQKNKNYILINTLICVHC